MNADCESSTPTTIEKICVVCGKPFVPNNIQLSKYCSAKCSQAAQTIRERERYARLKEAKKYASEHTAVKKTVKGKYIRRTDPLVPLKCAFCGKEFMPQRRAQIYCSLVCTKKAWVAKRSRERQAARIQETRICEFCGNPFPYDSFLHNKRFCSDKCKRQAERERRSYERTRADVCLLNSKDIADELPHELDELRDSKGKKYFKRLFALPEKMQLAEMMQWSEDDHCLALRYMKKGGGDCEEEDNQTISDFISTPECPSECEDEENWIV